MFLGRLDVWLNWGMLRGRSRTLTRGCWHAPAFYKCGWMRENKSNVLKSLTGVKEMILMKTNSLYCNGHGIVWKLLCFPGCPRLEILSCAKKDL